MRKEKLLTIRDFAELIGKHVDTVRGMIQRADIEAVNVGTDQRATWVIRESAVDDFFRRRSNLSDQRITRRTRGRDSSRELDELLAK